VARTGSALPAAAEVEQLYALASARPPLAEPAEVAGLYATLYDLALDRSDLVVVTAREVGELVGFGYGHPWHWAEQQDDWSAELAADLGDDAGQLDGSFAIQLLAVHPSFTNHGLGFELLKRTMVASVSAVHWLLVPDQDTPARRLYRRMGYRPLGHGPEAPNGSPGLVLIHG
jgi:ribosomal protein S18 acetylase RimI-like enzyme